VAGGSITVSAIAAAGGLQNNVTATDPIPTVLLPTITWATPAAIVYGNHARLCSIERCGERPWLSVTFTPTDNAHYAPVTTSVLLQVNQATPVINWPTTSAITQGTALSSAQLNATANVPGTFLYTPPSGTVLGAGPQQLRVQFTPTDAINYKVILAAVTLHVKQLQHQTASARGNGPSRKPSRFHT
jgi:hypothetical protein